MTLPLVKSSPVLDAPDFKLIRLGEKVRRLQQVREPLRAERERLWDLAMAEWKTFSLSIDANEDRWKAHMEKAGYVAAEDADSAVMDEIGSIQEQIRALRPTTFAGLQVKFAVVRDTMNIGDIEPRSDQDWHVMIFNEFADELGRLAKIGPVTCDTGSISKRSTNDTGSQVLQLFHVWDGVRKRMQYVDPSLTPAEDDAFTNKLSDECYKIEQRMLALPAEDALDVVAKFVALSGGGGFVVDEPSVLAEAASMLAAPPPGETISNPSVVTDAELIELGREFEKAKADARPLDAERRRLFGVYESEADAQAIPEDDHKRHRQIMKSSGYLAASDAFNAKHGEAIRLMKRIYRKRATTLAGFAVKLSAVTFDQFDFELGSYDAEDVAERQLVRLERDMRRVVVETPMAQRGALATVTAASAVVAAISPTSARVYRTGAKDVDTLLNELVDQFKEDAKAIDPTVKCAWIGRDMTFPGRDSAVMSIYLERDHAPFVRRRKA